MTRTLIVSTVAAVLAGAVPALGGTDPFLGETMIVASDYCPAGWEPMNGQLLTITSATSALFNLLGTAYGGDGVTNFALPTARPIFTATGAILTQCIATQGAFPQHP